MYIFEFVLIMNLQIFVSGRENEFHDERILIKKTIQKLGYVFRGSEDRYASDKPVSDNWREELNESQIYVGIFGIEDSPSTLEEFEIARGDQKPTLVFIKKLDHNDKPRSPMLESFLKQIQHPIEGITTSKFRDEVELEHHFIFSLAGLLSRKFRSNPEMSISSTQKSTEQLENDSNQNLGFGKITKFEIPNTIPRRETNFVSATFEGSAKNGFLDLMIKDSDGKKWTWAPDPGSWDAIRDEGKQDLDDKPYSNKWQFVIPKNLSPGYGTAFMGFYEDTFFLPTRNRRLVSYEIKKILIV